MSMYDTDLKDLNLLVEVDAMQGVSHQFSRANYECLAILSKRGASRNSAHCRGIAITDMLALRKVVPLVLP